MSLGDVKDSLLLGPALEEAMFSWCSSLPGKVLLATSPSTDDPLRVLEAQAHVWDRTQAWLSLSCVPWFLPVLKRTR